MHKVNGFSSSSVAHTHGVSSTSEQKISQTITKNQCSLVLLHVTNALYIKHKQLAIGFNLVTIAIQVNYVYRPKKKMRAISSNLNQNLNKRKKRLNDIYSLKENKNSVYTFKEVCSYSYIVFIATFYCPSKTSIPFFHLSEGFLIN